jgi:hypothetical protein
MALNTPQLIYDIAVTWQFTQMALQFVERDERAVGDMHLIPLCLRTDVQEERPLLDF